MVTTVMYQYASRIARAIMAKDASAHGACIFKSISPSVQHDTCAMHAAPPAYRCNPPTVKHR